MSNTMHWRTVPGAVVIAVHTNHSPSDEEWDACLAEIEAQDTKTQGLLVYTEAVGPTAAQRARSSEVFDRMKTDVKVGIMTTSRVVRGMVTALSWALGGNVKAFSTMDFEGVADYLELDGDSKLKTRVVLKQLARSAGTQVDAFADESGQFRKKYK